MFDLSSLNKEQKEAVQATEGAVLVLAGAGTGKTKVLTSRLAYIVSQGLCNLDEILAVTFTNKAATEMKERAQNLLVENGVFVPASSGLWIGTFHSLALRIIRPLHEKFNRSARFSIIDADDQLRVIKKILKENSIDDKQFQPKLIAYYINHWKDQCKSFEEAGRFLSKGNAETLAYKIYGQYQDLLENLDAIDFGDILMYCVNIFKYDQEILNRYHQKFKYIMVDEYQDTNIAQYLWLRLLSMGKGNICCVGDDDQSIYSWRGADVGNILKFEQDFKNAKVICLGQNYRSTKNILRTANALISNNSMRMKKEFWTNGEEGLPVIVKALGTPREEARFISSLIENKHKNGIKFSEMAILVRAAFQTRAFEERFIAAGIPYSITGGLKFYERREVKDAVAYLKLVVNPDDGLSFERIINVPKRGIGSTSMNKIYAISNEQKISLYAAAEFVSKVSTASIASKLREFFENMRKWREKLETLTPSELMTKILNESGYISMLKESKNIDDEARIETLEELVNALKDFETVAEFLDYISLVLDNIDSFDHDKVTISTIHAAKGLEFRTVFIPGFEEDIIPHKKSLEEKGELGIEEERRLCYVALTRAKKEAYITMCNKRNSFRDFNMHFVLPSRFFYDLPKNNSVKII